MRILTNDYLSNLPGATMPTKGGPPRFSHDFSAFTTDAGHTWIGVVNNPAERSTIPADLADSQRQYYFVPTREAVLRDTFKELGEGEPFIHLFDEEQKAIEQIIDAAQPDLVFLNGFSVFVWIFARAAFAKNIPVVIQHAGIFIREVDAYHELFSKASRDACAAMEKEATERAAANIFLNESSKRAFVESHPDAVIANPHTIPLPHAGWSFDQVVAHPERTERVIGAVARWDRIKNHEALLALAEEIQRQGLPWKVRVVTGIPKTPERLEYKTAYRTHLEVVAPMERYALKAFYASLDVLVLPSHFDTVGGVVMEALAEGRPTLIAPSVGWVDEYKDSGMDDWIVSFNDSSEVVARLAAQFTREAWPEVQKLSEHVQYAHNPTAVYAAYLALFSSLVTHP